MQTKLCFFCQVQASASIIVVFLFSTGMIKMFLKTMRKKK